jgi:SAM-dependent methyltransferase
MQDDARHNAPPQALTPETAYQSARTWGSRPTQFFFVTLPYLKGKVLDVACGRGLHLSYLGDEAVGVDISDENRRCVRALGRRFVKHDLNFFPWPFADSEFNSVHSSHTLEHVRAPVDFLAECNRVLKPQGHLVLFVPHETWLATATRYHPYFAHPYHLYSFSPDCLKRLCTITGFSVLRRIHEPMRRVAERIPRILIRLWCILPHSLVAPFSPSYALICQKILAPGQVDIEQTARHGFPVEMDQPSGRR